MRKYRIIEKTFHKDTVSEYKLYYPQYKSFWKWRYYTYIDGLLSGIAVDFQSIDLAKQFLESKMRTNNDKVVWEGQDGIGEIRGLTQEDGSATMTPLQGSLTSE